MCVSSQSNASLITRGICNSGLSLKDLSLICRNNSSVNQRPVRVQLQPFYQVSKSLFGINGVEPTLLWLHSKILPMLSRLPLDQ